MCLDAVHVLVVRLSALIPACLCVSPGVPALCTLVGFWISFVVLLEALR